MYHVSRFVSLKAKYSKSTIEDGAKTILSLNMSKGQ